MKIGALQIGIQREERRVFFHVVAFAHHHGLDAALFVRADENQVCLDPALEFIVGRLVAGAERQYRAKQAGGCNAMKRHGDFLSPKMISRCARIIASTSSGAKRSNNPLQITAIRPGAAKSCGNFA